MRWAWPFANVPWASSTASHHGRVCLVVVVRFGRLGLVIAAAMVINLMTTALAAILAPLALDHFDLDRP